MRCGGDHLRRRALLNGHQIIGETPRAKAAGERWNVTYTVDVMSEGRWLAETLAAQARAGPG